MEGCRDFRAPLSPPSRRRPPATANGRSSRAWWRGGRVRKYAVSCCVCGMLSLGLGLAFVVLCLLLRHYTSSLHLFETLPAYVPGLVFIITGLIFLCLARRKNRYAFLMKIAGGCGLVCALLCVVMTVTTTVIHMNRLQTLHECVYTPQARTCMCVSVVGDTVGAQESHRFVFNNTPNCEVVHGSLYSCLRALFSFSVLGILLCISCSMLTYQLLSHEKKRKYWEQLELRRRFMHHRHSHHCGCYDQVYPWQLWEMLDHRLLGSNNIGGCYATEEESHPPNTLPRNHGHREHGNNSGHHRSSGWNWLPWPRQQRTERNRHNTERTDASVARNNMVNRFAPGDPWNQQIGNMDSAADDTCIPSDSVESLPWSSECIHIFRPNPRSSNCLPRFGIRPRCSPYGRPHASHRRTRSNDGVFHHLHMSPRYPQPISVVDGICQFPDCEIPRYLWGPPPPYSQPPSLENLSLYANTGIRPQRPQLALEQLSDGRVATLEHGNNSVSSKVSTPKSERRFVCHNFASDGITLTIGGEYDSLVTEHGRKKEDDTCVVEVHVPYIFHKKDVVFNTLPARSSRRKTSNPFKSLSNIPLGLPRRLKAPEPDSELLSVIKACCDLQDSSVVHVKSSKDTFNNRQTNVEIEPHGSVSYRPTLVEVPSDFKSSLVISNSPDFTITNKVCGTQSMPNLNASGCSSVMGQSLQRDPSSSNTSTSQDIGDFDFEDEYIVCSPLSDVPSLPNDDNDSSLCYRPFRNPGTFETPITKARTTENDSDSSSCGGVIVVEGKELSERRTSDGYLHSSPSIIISKRQPIDCPINCTIRHLHNYHLSKSDIRDGKDRTSNFVVTIKSVKI